MCPLCRVVHKTDREYVWQFSEEGFGSEETMAKVAAARGFCPHHAGMLTAIDQQVKSMLGVSTIYVELMADIGRDLARLGPSDEVERDMCPACVDRDEAVHKNAGYLLAELSARAGTIAELYPWSPGLCFPHFEIVWNRGGTDQVRALVLEVQRRAVEGIERELNEFIRKEGAEARQEPRGDEQDAWQRALWLTAGWPAPTASAGVPEEH
jgi:hypothetical protein